MENADVLWVKSRSGVYQFFMNCLAQAPLFHYILKLLDQELYRYFQQIELFCPTSLEFKKSLQAWKDNTRVRRKVSEDYMQLYSSNSSLKNLFKLLSEMVVLLNQEDIARKTKQVEAIRQSLTAQKKLIEEKFLPERDVLRLEAHSLCQTPFYRSLTKLVIEFMLSDYQKLNRTLTVIEVLEI